MSEVGRNSPCPCGSGKKFKRCCLDNPGAIVSVKPAAPLAPVSPDRSSASMFASMHGRTTPCPKLETADYSLEFAFASFDTLKAAREGRITDAVAVLYAASKLQVTKPELARPEIVPPDAAIAAVQVLSDIEIAAEIASFVLPVGGDPRDWLASCDVQPPSMTVLAFDILRVNAKRDNRPVRLMAVLIEVWRRWFPDRYAPRRSWTPSTPATS